MSLSHAQFDYVKPEAFAPRVKMTEEKSNHYVYKNGSPSVTSYNKDKKNNAYQEQFGELLETLASLGKSHFGSLNLTSTFNNIKMIEKDFFSKTAKQPPVFFVNVKKNLEDFIVALQDKSISQQKRENAYRSICENISQCGSGLYTHLEAELLSLTSKDSLNNWLAEYRTSIIIEFAAMYSLQHSISTGDHVHLVTILSRYANNQGWNPEYCAEGVHDEVITVLQEEGLINEETLISFHEYFTVNFNPRGIHRFIQNKIDCRVGEIFNEYGFNGRKGSTEGPDYQKFITRIKTVFNGLGVIITKEDEFLQFNEECTQFELRDLKPLVTTMCEKILSSSLYFDPKNNVYHELVPLHWLNKKGNKTKINLSIWENISDENFSFVLLRLLNDLSLSGIKILLENLPIERLEKMTGDLSFTIGVSAIKESEKRRCILDKMSTLLQSTDILKISSDDSSNPISDSNQYSIFRMMIRMSKENLSAEIKLEGEEKNEKLRMEDKLCMKLYDLNHEHWLLLLQHSIHQQDDDITSYLLMNRHYDYLPKEVLEIPCLFRLAKNNQVDLLALLLKNQDCTLSHRIIFEFIAQKEVPHRNIFKLLYSATTNEYECITTVLPFLYENNQYQFIASLFEYKKELKSPEFTRKKIRDSLDRLEMKDVNAAGLIAFLHEYLSVLPDGLRGRLFHPSNNKINAIHKLVKIARGGEVMMTDSEMDALLNVDSSIINLPSGLLREIVHKFYSIDELKEFREAVNKNYIMERYGYKKLKKGFCVTINQEQRCNANELKH